MTAEALRVRLPEADAETIGMLIASAEAFVLAYTGRRTMTPALEAVVAELTVRAYNRLGMEGETVHTEGEVTHTAELLPEDMRRWLNALRLARTCGA